MSDRGQPAPSWHGRCKYPGQTGGTCPGRKSARATETTSSGKRRARRRNPQPDNNKKTLLHSKQASDRIDPAPSGVFFSTPGGPRKQKGQPSRAAHKKAPRLARQDGIRAGTRDRCAIGLPASFAFRRPPRRSPSPSKPQPHFESPQFRHVMQPSIMITAAVLHLPQSCAPSGKCDFANASVCLARASNSARFSSTSLRWC